MINNKLSWLGWLFIVSWLSASTSPAKAQPIAPAADGTNTVVTPNGNRYDISGGSSSPDRANLFHSFTEFGLSDGQIANFLTNPNIQNILGRINGGNPSLINGLIKVTGGNSNLFLMNPSGIIFGPNATLNVPGSFTATTATGIGFGGDRWFSAIGNNNWASSIGTPNTFAFTNLQPGSIVNAGNLTVPTGQSLTLIGGTVVSTGQLSAPSGNITMTAVPGQNLVRIAQAGNLLSLEIQPTANQSSLPNNSTQPVLSLPQLLTGKGLEQATGLAVNQNGEVVLTGNMAVPVTAGTAIASGNLNVSGNTGGTVNILGDRVAAIGSKIDASGINGGGSVLIGGDYQGLGTVPNAARTFVSADSTVNADAVSNGNGGRVIVWADETTRFNGNITARGGLFSGNGGFAEVSGKQSLDFQGLVDLRSTFGIAGTLLLDPTDITISTGVDAGGSLSAEVFAPSAATSTINNGTLQTQLGLGNVTISTASGFASAGNITVTAPISWDNKNSLTLKANNNITINNKIATQGGNITLNADSDSVNGGVLNILSSTINTNGGIFLGNGSGNAVLGNGIDIQESTINAGGGNISLNGSAGNTSSNSGILVDANSTLQTTGSGNITLNGTNGSSVNSSGIVLRGPTISSVNGDITFTGSGNGTGEGIFLFSSAVVKSTGTGSITMTGTGGNQTSGSNEGIVVTGTSKVTSANGNISLTGIGNGTANGSNGIDINTSSTVESTAAGKVTLNGTAGNGTFGNRGISIDSSIVRSTGGSVSLTGTGAGTATQNTGVRINNSTVESTLGNGTVTIAGTGGNGTDSNEGISIDNPSTVKSQNGDIALTGTGKGSGGNNRGIASSGVVASTGTGNVTLGGVGGNGTDGNQGISLGGKVSSLSGNVSLTGTGGGTGTANEGIYVDGGAKVNTAGAGKVTLTGTGSAGTGTNSGIWLNSGTVESQNGDITLTGTGVGAAFSSYGINLAKDLPITVKATGTGNINFTGSANSNSIPVNLDGGAIDAALGGNVTLTGDEIQLSATSQVKGTGTIQLQPLTPSLDITAGGNTADARLNLSAAELAPPVLNGFSKMIIGRTDGTGTIAIDPAGVTFSYPVTLQAPTIAVNGNITGANNASITFNAATINLNANIITKEQNINFGGKVSLAAGSNVKLDTGLENAGDINFGGTVDGDGNLSLSAGTGKIDVSAPFGETIPLRSLTTTTAAIDVKNPIDFSIKTTGDLTAGSIRNPGRAIALTSSNGNISTSLGAIDTASTTGNGGPIALTGNNITASNLNSSSTAGNGGKITLTGQTGDVVTVSSPVVWNSSSTSGAAGDIAIAAPNQVGANVIDAKGLVGTGNISISGNEIGFSGGVDSVKSQGNLSINPFSPNVGIRFQTGLAGDPQALDLGTPFLSSLANGFSGIVFGGKTTTGNITVENLSVSFKDPVTFNTQGTISVNPDGSIAGTDNASITLNATINSLNGNITSQSQNITINGNTLVGKNVAVSTGNAAGGDILFANNIDGTGNLTLETGTAKIGVQGAIGNTTGLGDIAVKSAGTTTFNAVKANSLTANAGGTTELNGNVTTTASQTYGDAVTIANNPTLAGNGIAFNDPVNGDSNLTVKGGSGDVTFKSAIGNNNALKDLTVNSTGTTAFSQTVKAQSLTTDAGGTTQIKGNVTTTGAQIYPDAVSVANNPILSGNSITFTNTVDGNSDLTLNAGSGSISVSGDLGKTAPLNNLTANSKIILGGNVTTNSAQNYADAVTIANNPILKGNAISFTKTVDGNSDLTLNAGTGSISVSGEIGKTAPLNNLTANSKISLGGNVTTTANQTYKEAVTIAKNSAIAGDSITFNSTVDVAGDIAIVGGDINLQGIFTTTNDGKLTITNKGNLNLANNLNLDGELIQDGTGAVAVSGNITTTNDNISFSGPVTLKAPVNFALGNAKIAFGSKLSAGDNPLNLTAGEIDFSGQVSGTKELTLQPASLGQNIVVGGTDNNTSDLDLTASEINQFQNGFSSIAIGRGDSTGNITIANNLSLFDKVNIQTKTGAIAVNGTIAGFDDSSVALNAPTINLNNGINTTKNINVTGNVQLGSDINLKSSAGNINITGAIDGNQLLNIDAANANVLVRGNIGQTTPLSGLNVTASNTQLGGNVTTNNGNINISNALRLTKDATLSTAGGNIAFGAIDSDSINARNLTLASGSGSISFGAPVGATSKLGNILIQNAGNVTANSTINAQQLTAQNTEQVKLSGDVTAGKVDITATGDIGVKNITASGGEIIFNSGNNFTAGNLNTSGNIGSPITVKATTSITAGQINSSGTFGNAGNVFLDPIGDIQVEFINAQGGTSGKGGDVTATTGNFFRATNSFPTAFSPTGVASISTAGGAGNGNITITHGGGDAAPPVQPFVVGDATINGTAAAITTGQSIIQSQSFPRSTQVGNITIVTDDAIDPIIGPTNPETNPPTNPETNPPTTPETNPPTIPETNPPTIPETNPPTIPETNPPTIGPTIPETIVPTNPEIIPPTIPPETGTNQPIIPPRTGTILPTIPQETATTPPTIPQETATTPPIIPQETGTTPPTIPQETGTNQQENQQSTVIKPQPTIVDRQENQQLTIVDRQENQQPTIVDRQENQQLTIVDRQENQQPTIVDRQENQQLTIVDRQENQQLTSPLESVQESLQPVPVTTPKSPAKAAKPTPKPETSTLDSEPIPPRRISRPDNSGGVADRILTIDRSITNQLPTGLLASSPASKESQTANPTANLVLGYAPPPDRLFEETNLEKTIWGIETIRNQEFGSYLGIKGNLPDQNAIVSKFQENLKTIEQKTGKRSGIIYIVSREEKLELILVPPVGQPIHYSVPEANRTALFPTVKKLIDEITNRNKLRTTSYLAAAKQLYQWSIAPLEKDLERLGIQTLLLSVDPGLRSLPFAALHDGKGFLIQKYNFSLIPSFSTTNTDYKAVSGATVLAMGRSEFVDNTPLPSVPIELQTISAQWRGPSFLNSTFTLENLNSQHSQQGFRIVHLATHATFQPGKASNSYIQLWNGKLHLDRMESLNWRNPQVDLVTLSACRTALGDRESELGFGGLAVKSGAKSALASLWYVDDRGTLGLMAEFYQQLRGATIKSEALQLAQQAMISGKVRLENGQLVTTSSQVNLPPNLQQQNQNFSHPYYWSSFTMIGNPW